MLSGKPLGEAIALAIAKKGVRKAAVAKALGVSPSSVQDWISRGTISKENLASLWEYFRDDVGPEHWGLSGATLTIPSPSLSASGGPVRTIGRLVHSLFVLKDACQQATPQKREELRKLFDLYLSDPVRYEDLMPHIEQLLRWDDIDMQR